MQQFKIKTLIFAEFFQTHFLTLIKVIFKDGGERYY